MTSHPEHSNEEKTFGEFRRKVKSAEVRSASMEHLLMSLHSTGRVSILMQNGRVLKSGYRKATFINGMVGRRRRERTKTIKPKRVSEISIDDATMRMFYSTEN